MLHYFGYSLSFSHWASGSFIKIHFPPILHLNYHERFFWELHFKPPSPPLQISLPSITTTFFSPTFTIISLPPYFSEGGINHEVILIWAYPFFVHFLQACGSLWILLFTYFLIKLSKLSIMKNNKTLVVLIGLI